MSATHIGVAHAARSSAEGVLVQHAPVSEALRPYVRALMAAEVAPTGPLPLAIAPHESLVLSVQIGRSNHAIEQKGRHGENVCLTGIRQWTGTFTGAGDCISLFALLTPLGLVHLLESRPLDKVPRIRAPVAAMLDRGVTRRLESDVALATGLDGKLHAFGAWLEQRAHARRELSRAALRAARAAMRVCAEPAVPVTTLADQQHVGRRQLERDFQQWIGTSPRHLAQVARLQAVSRKAQTGASLADIAADLGYADQAHMSRAVRQLTGLTPRGFIGTRDAPIARAFRRATGGGTVYL